MNAVTILPSRRSFRQRLSRLLALAEQQRVWMAFSVALFLACAVYRATLAARIYFGAEQPSSLQPSHVPLVAFLKSLGSDWVVVTGITLLYLAARLWLCWRAPRFVASRVLSVMEALGAGVVLFVFALILRAHGQLLFELETGLTATVLFMAPMLFGTKDVFHLFSVADEVFLATPLLAFALFIALAGWLRRIYKPVWLLITVAVLLVQFIPSGKKLSAELSENPVRYFVGDVLKAPLRSLFGAKNLFLTNKDLPGKEQMQSIQLVDTAFVTTATNTASNTAATTRPLAGPWNVIIFVLESSGADYVFNTSDGKEMPMPFLRQMADEGLYLANHHAAANSSPSAIFSIFTGMYPRPTSEQFAMTKEAAIPTLNRYLDGYESFLVHPSSLTYSFPQYLFLNNGIRELNNQDVLPKSPAEDLTPLARNELNAVDFFISRVANPRQPFLGIYWSFIPHHPYSDYGPEYRVRSDLKNKRDLYYNNLRTLDVQLRRIYENLVRSGLADRSVLVFVGDHGEAFGQHPGVWAHSFGSYSEMFRAPVVFWQPKLISPQTIQFPTSHVDIIPTLLDILGILRDESRFQGGSVLKGESPRKYIFNMDAQADHLSAIDGQMNKVTLDMDYGHVLVFNLAKDPGEKVPLNEANFPAQIEAILKFRNYQTRLIDDYNAAVLAGRSFPPTVRDVKSAESK